MSVTWAALAFALSGAAALLGNLGLVRTMLVSGARMVLQLLLVGFVLRWVFAHERPALTAALLLFMLLAATYETAARQEHRLRGLWRWVVGGLPIAAATSGVVLVATVPLPYSARTLIPITGIVLGSSMNAASISLHHFFDAVRRERAPIEARLALGVEIGPALSLVVRRSTRAGLIPSLNQMAGAGVITLPGIMTGQLLAGVDPVSAAEYQVATMFVLAGGSFFSAYGAARLAARRCTDERQRLRLDRFEVAS